MTQIHDVTLSGFQPGKGSPYDYLPAWMQVPKLGETESQSAPLALIKLFTPDAGWTWFITEYDGQDTLFGLVVGLETESGYFSLAELRQARGPWGLSIERDLWFTPTPLSQLPEYRAKWGDNGPYKRE